jgi:hypothetical protein
MTAFSQMLKLSSMIALLQIKMSFEWGSDWKITWDLTKNKGKVWWKEGKATILKKISICALCFLFYFSNFPFL